MAKAKSSMHTSADNKEPLISGNKALQALGDPTRRAIFEKLRPGVGGGLSVAEIAEGMPVSRPAVSQHVKVLQEARLIRVRKEGTRSICEIDPAGILAMRTWLDQFWDSALQAFKQAAENLPSHG